MDRFHLLSHDAGECYYQMGELAKALEHYNSAVRLYSQFSDWFLRVQFPATLRPAGRGAYRQVTWGASTRGATLGYFSDSTLMGQGKLDNQTPFGKAASYRCRAGAGPGARDRALHGVGDPAPVGVDGRGRLLRSLTMEVLNKLSARPGPPNHWSEAWIDVQLGLAMVAAGRDQQATLLLQRGVVAAGQYDHPLTPTALLSLGFLALRQARIRGHEVLRRSDVCRRELQSMDIVEEAFYYGTVTHLVTNRKGMYPPLAPAIPWCKSRASRRILAGLCLMAAENAAAIDRRPTPPGC